MCKARGSQYLFFPERFLGQRVLSMWTHVHACKAIFKRALISMQSHPKVLHINRKARGTVYPQLDCGTSEEGIRGPPEPYHQPQAPLTCELSLKHQGGHCQIPAPWADGPNDLMLSLKPYVSIAGLRNSLSALQKEKTIPAPELI